MFLSNATQTTNPFAVTSINNSSNNKMDQKRRRKEGRKRRTSKQKDASKKNPYTNFKVFQSTESSEAFNNLLNIITDSADNEYNCRQPKSFINWDEFNKNFQSMNTNTKKEVLKRRDTMINNQRTLLMYLLSIEGGPPEDVVSTLLDIDPSAVRMKEKSFRNWTCLTFAVYYNSSIEVVQRLIDAYPEADAPLHFAPEKDGGDNTPLHFFQSNTSLEIVEILLKKFPYFASMKNEKGLLPLHVATQRKLSLEIIRRLLDAYPEAIFQKYDGSKTLPLHLACQNTNVTLEEIKLLLEHDVDKKTMLEKDSNNWLPLRYACENNVSIEVMQFLLQSFVNAKMKGICNVPYYRSKIDAFLKNLPEEKKDYISYYEKIEKFTSHYNLIEATTLLELNLQKENCLHGIVVIMNRTLDFINEKNGPDRMVSDKDENDDDEEESVNINDDEKNTKNNNSIFLFDDDLTTEDETSDEEMSL